MLLHADYVLLFVFLVFGSTAFSSLGSSDPSSTTSRCSIHASIGTIHASRKDIVTSGKAKPLRMRISVSRSASPARVGLAIACGAMDTAMDCPVLHSPDVGPGPRGCFVGAGAQVGCILLFEGL